MRKVHLTENAAQRMKDFLNNRGKGEGVKLGIQTSGCSGLAYVFEFVDNIDENDLIFEEKGVKLFIDPKSMVYLDGVEVDYGKEGVNEGFKFKNPNSSNECGCGESFTV